MTHRTQSTAAPTAALLPEGARPRLGPCLEKAGYALGELASAPAVAVVDLTEAGGFEALARVRKAGAPETGVLAIFGGDPADAARALREGADGFIAAASLEAELGLRLEAVRRLAEARREQLRRERKLDTLLELSATYASALEAGTLMHDVTRRLAEELSIDRCALVLLEDDRARGHVVAASDDRALRDVVIDLSLYPEIGEAVRIGRPVVVDDVGNHPLLDGVKEAVQRRGIASLAAVPVAVHAKTLGVLLLRASGSGKFEPHEVEFAWTVANATAIALRNARMIEGLRGEARRAEAELAELARYEGFFQYVSDGIAVVDPSGAFVSLNPAGAQMLGLDAEKAKGRRIASLVCDGSAQAVEEIVSCLERGLGCRNVDIEVCTPDLRMLTLSVSGAALPDNLGGILSFRDVTEARGMERELRKTKDFLEKLVHSSVDAIVAADLRGRILVYNRSAERILGYSSEEAVRELRMAQLFAEGMAEALMQLIRSPDHGGYGRLEPTRVELVAKSGQRIPVMMSAALLFENETPFASVTVFSDLRERAALEAKLTRAQERLQEAEKQSVIVELAGTAAHELNQPLTSVMGYAELLKRKLKQEDPAYRPVDIIYREAERMAEIVRKIGKITKYETKAYIGGSRIVDLDRAAGDDD